MRILILDYSWSKGVLPNKGTFTGTIKMEKLSHDEVSHIVTYLDLASFLQFGFTCHWNYELCQSSSAWTHIIKQILQGFSPIEILEGAPFKQKLRHWLTRENHAELSIVGSCRLFQPRYIHRSCRLRNSCTREYESYIFGGDYLEGQTLSNRSDLWKVLVSEATAEITFVPQQLTFNSTTRTRMNFSGGSASAICSLQGALYVFGGIDSSRTFTDQMVRFQPAGTADSWIGSHLPPNPAANLPDQTPHVTPAARWGHTLVNAYDSFLVLFGGSCPGKAFGDLWVFRPDQSWLQVKFPANWPRPAGRSGHGVSVVGDYMYVIGGNNINRNFNDMWTLSLITLYDMLQCPSPDMFDFGGDHSALWQCVSSDCAREDGPAARVGHTCTAIGSSIVVYGGRDFHKRTFHEGVFLFDTEKRKWQNCRRLDRLPHENEEPLKRTGHVAIPASSGVLYVGGLAASGRVTNDVLHLNILGLFPGTHQSGADFCSESVYTIKEVEV